ncbi:hypothetical protein DP42_4192 [Burkholderia pseudomallei]|nr:hypothetical protein DP42_4192 [Burkholderia pseudomallei]
MSRLGQFIRQLFEPFRKAVGDELTEVAAQIRTIGSVVWPWPEPAIMLAKEPEK